MMDPPGAMLGHAAPPAPERATYRDVLEAPAHRVAEVVGGMLHTLPRPAMPHAHAGSSLHAGATEST